jgi:hypothetical protein
MEIIAGLSAFAFGLLCAIWATVVIVDGLKDRVWNWRLSVVCLMLGLCSGLFLLSSSRIFTSRFNLLPGLFMPEPRPADSKDQRWRSIAALTAPNAEPVV